MAGVSPDDKDEFEEAALADSASSCCWLAALRDPEEGARAVLRGVEYFAGDTLLSILLLPLPPVASGQLVGWLCRFPEVYQLRIRSGNGAGRGKGAGSEASGLQMRGGKVFCWHQKLALKAHFPRCSLKITKP